MPSSYETSRGDADAVRLGTGVGGFSPGGTPGAVVPSPPHDALERRRGGECAPLGLGATLAPPKPPKPPLPAMCDARRCRDADGAKGGGGAGPSPEREATRRLRDGGCGSAERASEVDIDSRSLLLSGAAERSPPSLFEDALRLAASSADASAAAPVNARLCTAV